MTTLLPFRAITASGEQFDISFPLHPQTASPMRVAQMLSTILSALDAEVKLDPGTSNGDVLQALAMALSIRASMIEAPKELTDRLSADLVFAALAAMNDAERHYMQQGLREERQRIPLNPVVNGIGKRQNRRNGEEKNDGGRTRGYRKGGSSQ